jgi:transposase-like protein
MTQARVDETYIEVKVKGKYLYRAVNSKCNTLDFLLTANRDAQAAKRFSRKALKAFKEPILKRQNARVASKMVSRIKEPLA